jgi:hypothetical protein
MEISFTGYQGNLQHTGSGDYFNINNLSNDDVTITFTGDNWLSVSGGTTRVTIIDKSTGNIEVDNQLVDLVESGHTGTMADGGDYDYTIVSIGNKSYMLLDDFPDPYFPAQNPFFQTLNPISSNPSTDPHPICFVSGTYIQTPGGDVVVEELQVGDIVLTRDSGEQEIVWVGSRKLSGFAANKFAPIRISAGAFGDGLPNRDLLVSPQHRILVSDWRAELLFGASEVLVAAKYLVNDSSICVETRLDLFSYHHILFEKHETVFSEDLPTESFHPGDMALGALGDVARAELLELFPELADLPAGDRQLSHRTLKGFEAKALAAI